MSRITIEPALRVEPFSTDLAEAKEQLKEIVKFLTKDENKPDVQSRVFIVDLVIEEYVHATQQRPDSFQLYGLGGYILADYLGDQYKHLRKNEENTFQTDKRMKKNHARHRTAFIGDRQDV
jgi:hypothetical protein